MEDMKKELERLIAKYEGLTEEAERKREPETLGHYSTGVLDGRCSAYKEIIKDLKELMEG